MLLYYSQLGAHESFWALLPGLLIGGVGMGLTMTPTTAAAMSSVPVDKAGVGSAVLNSSRQVGGSLGIAVMGAIVAAGCRVARTRPSAFLHGFHDALRVAALLAFAGASSRLRRSASWRTSAAPHGGGGRGGVTRIDAAKPRLTADARRQAVLDTACRVFSRSSYRGATTAEIAREAGISEPILYRHFGSKRDLYLACLDEAWRSFREVCRAGDRRRPRHAASARSPTPTWRSGRGSGWSTSGSRRSPRPPRTA